MAPLLIRSRPTSRTRTSPYDMLARAYGLVGHPVNNGVVTVTPYASANARNECNSTVRRDAPWTRSGTGSRHAPSDRVQSRGPRAAHHRGGPLLDRDHALQ